MAESCDRIVRTLRSRGMPIDVVHLSRRHPWLQVAQRTGGLELRSPVGLDAAHDLNVVWAWLDARRAGWTHVVAFGGELPLVAGPAFAAWLGLPLVCLLRGNDFDAAVLTPRRRPVLEAALRGSAASAAVASGMAHRASSLFCVPVRWIPNGIDLDAWRASDGDRSRAAALRSDDDRVVIGLIGHLKAKNCAVLFLEALRRSGLTDRVRLCICSSCCPST